MSHVNRTLSRKEMGGIRNLATTLEFKKANHLAGLHFLKFCSKKARLDCQFKWENVKLIKLLVQSIPKIS